MTHEPQIVEVTAIQGEVIYTTYVSPEDGQRWGNRCIVDEQTQQVMWGTDTGRWRDHPLDEKLFYSVQGNTLTISFDHVYSPGNGFSYTLEQLQ